uniref:Transposase-associated domain-containing protein n=1 Tax=Solanum lycopersicum TaxID=4081 RepID=A0A3Q7GDV1_SOLLC
MEFAHRNWMMYDRTHPNRSGLRVEFMDGVKEFIAKAKTENDFLIEDTIRCSCAKCKCIKLLKQDKVELHIIKRSLWIIIMCGQFMERMRSM